MTKGLFRIGANEFAALASGSDAASDILIASQTSKRLLMLHVLVEEARTRRASESGRVGLDRSAATLAAARRGAPTAVDRMLLAAPVGRWALHCLRHVRDQAAEEEMVVAELAYFGALAAVAAFSAGLPSESIVRLAADGSLVFPVLGHLQLDAGARWAIASTQRTASGAELSVLDRGRRRIAIGARTPPDAAWRPFGRLTATADGQTFAVCLDDLDPYRIPPELRADGQQGPEALASWRESFRAAWSLLVTEHPVQAAAIARGVSVLTPLSSAAGDLELSATSGDAFGRVALTRPRDGHGMALALVHEYQHSKLSALMDLVPLFTSGSDEVYYAPWRPDPRPLGGLLQGSYAHLGLLLFWKAEAAGWTGPLVRLAQYELALWRHSVRVALRQAAASGLLTRHGLSFLDGMRQSVNGIFAFPVPELSRALAAWVAADYWLSWRLRNLVPDDEVLESWLSAWRRGDPTPPRSLTPHILPGRRGSLPNGRSTLARIRLAEPERFWSIAAGPVNESGDFQLIAGVSAEAARHYRERLMKNPSDRDALVGLGLALRAHSDPSARGLIRAPELTAGLLTRLAEDGEFPDPTRLSGWVGKAAPTSRTGIAFPSRADRGATPAAAR